MRRSALGALRKFMDIRYRVPTHDRRTSFSDFHLVFFVTLLYLTIDKKKMAKPKALPDSCIADLSATVVGSGKVRQSRHKGDSKREAVFE